MLCDGFKLNGMSVAKARFLDREEGLGAGSK